MKSINEFTLNNMVQIERYMRDEMSAEEKQEFLTRLSTDKELQDDYEMAKGILLIEQTRSSKQATPLNKLSFFDNGNFKVSRKGIVGKQLIGSGIMTVLAVVFMILTCALIISIIA